MKLFFKSFASQCFKSARQFVMYTAVQSQKAASAYFTSKHMQPYGFAEVSSVTTSYCFCPCYLPLFFAIEGCTRHCDSKGVRSLVGYQP